MVSEMVARKASAVYDSLPLSLAFFCDFCVPNYCLFIYFLLSEVQQQNIDSLKSLRC